MTTTINESHTRCVAVTPSDSADLNVSHGIPYARKIRITGNGTIRFTTLGGDLVNETVTAGQLIDWVAVRRVHSTGTTATCQAIF